MLKRMPIVLFLGTLALGGCASSDLVTKDPQIAALSAPLSAGMRQVADKAFMNPDLDHLFAAAFSGLSALDQNLRFGVNDRELTVRYGEMLIARADRPPPQEIGPWVQGILRMIVASRNVSRPLAQASSETLLETLYGHITSQMDRYTEYANAEVAGRNRAARGGSVGLGFNLQQVPSGALVTSVLPHGPADVRGMKAGDVVTHINRMRLAGVPLPQILKRLRGRVGSTARLAVVRNGEVLNFRVERALIVPESVSAEYADGILHLRISKFNSRTAQSIAAAVAAAPARGIILDMRSDPGGLLDQAIEVADMFLDQGTIASLEGRHPAATQFYSASPGDIASGLPILMLVDGLSASSAEILAAALQENGRAAAIGTATVGKGSVQTLIRLANGGELAVTWARVRTPDGKLLDERGILPDICTWTAPTHPDLSVDEVIARALSKPAGDALANNAGNIRALRQGCRPQPRKAETVDRAVALKLLREPALWAALHLPAARQLSANH